jgi:hypothetical protein
MEGTFRRAGALAVAAIVGLGAIVLTAAPAVAGHRVAAGTYSATFPATSTIVTLSVTNAPDSTTSGSWAMSNNDAGVWVIQGSTIAFEVSYSEIGHADALMIGKLGADGIGPATMSVPGGAPEAWSAARALPPPAATPTTAGPAATDVRASAKLPGAYTAQFPGFSDALTIARNAVAKTTGTFTLTNLGDGGNWLKMGTKIVLGVATGDDEGILLLGTTTPTSISSFDKPGVYYQYQQGTFPWYATRNA